MPAFFAAMVLGFSIAAPVGPIGVLCVRRTLADGRRVGLACGLGAATADMLYGLVGALGLTAVTRVLVGANAWMRVVGCVWLVYLGVKTFRAKPPAEAADAKAGRGILAAWSSTFLLTITNPATILSFAAMFTAIDARGNAAVLAAGVFAGSAMWWLLLSAVVDLFRHRVGPRELGLVNRASGVLLIAFAAWALLA